jgi:hypothetical protein
VHHIPEASHGLGPIAPKVPVDAWVGDAVVEAVNDIFFGDVCDGGSNIEETTRV